MALKTTMKVEGVNLEGEPIYDTHKMEIYCKERNISIADLTIEEKQQFIVGMMSFTLPLSE